jgi:hypothetical protein
MVVAMAETILERRRAEGQEFFSSEDVVGKRVKNPEGYDLGEISSLRIGLPTGKVAYAVLRTGGMLGLGSKIFAIPIEAMVYRPGDDVFVVNISKHKIDSESGFSEGDWPREANWNLIESTRPMGPPSQEEARAVTRTEATPRETVTTGQAGAREIPVREERPIKAEEVEGRTVETRTAAEAHAPTTGPLTRAREETGARRLSFAHLSAADLQVYLKGMDYPAGKRDLVAHARGMSAPEDVIAALETFGERTYQSAADVSTEFGKLR